jgi:hypothetical protein
MSVNFWKKTLALSLALFSAAGSAKLIANDGFYGQPGQMSGNIPWGAPPMSHASAPMPLPSQFPMQGPSGPMPGPSVQHVDQRFGSMYGQPSYGGSPYGTPVPMPQSAPQLHQLEPVKIQVPDGSSPVDLVIENIRYSEPGTLLVGPSYHVKVCNKGSAYASCFHIGLFASLDGVVNEQTPKAFLEVRDLAPGTAIEYTIRLPVNADSNFDPMTRQIRPFTHVAAAVDVFRVQPEGDESNNTAILPRVVVDNAD